jgi:hypothetical protein
VKSSTLVWRIFTKQRLFFYTNFSHRINKPVEERVFSLITLFFFKKEQETEVKQWRSLAC